MKLEKPFSTYNGGKESDGTYQKIINLMPPHFHYYEPFLGNGAIFRHKKRATLNTINDIDSDVVKEWKPIVENDVLISLRNETAFDILQELHNTDYPSILMYLDPPYLFSTRKNKRNIYKHEFTEVDHIRLLNDVRSLTHVKILISSYPNDLYDEYLKNWNSYVFKSSTRRGMRIEKVWFNYDRPTELHDYSYLGDNYRQRERIKNTIKNTVAKINRMSPLMKNFFLDELNKKKNDDHI